jgi:hypothetical protein
MEMGKISEYLIADQTRCDDALMQLKAEVTRKKWNVASAAFEQFNSALERHFKMEESVVFAAFENSGPASAVRREHQTLRVILGCIWEDVRQHDAHHFFGHVDTLRVVLRHQYSRKKSALYAMLDSLLSDRSDEIIDTILDENSAALAH